MVVDPAFKAAGSPDGKRGEIDKEKTVHVVSLSTNAVVGDVALLPNVVKRTASCVATTQMSVYKISRALLLRTLGQDQVRMRGGDKIQALVITSSSHRMLTATAAFKISM